MSTCGNFTACSATGSMSPHNSWPHGKSVPISLATLNRHLHAGCSYVANHHQQRHLAKSTIYLVANELNQGVISTLLYSSFVWTIVYNRGGATLVGRELRLLCGFNQYTLLQNRDNTGLLGTPVYYSWGGGGGAGGRPLPPPPLWSPPPPTPPV